MTAPTRPQPSSRRGPSDRPVTPHQLHALRLAASGLTQAAIGRELGIDASSVGKLMTEVFRKLDAANAPNAVLLACRAGLLEPAAEGDGVIGARYLEALRFAAAGMTNAEIGAELHIATDTVKWRLNRAYRLLGTNDRAHAVVIAARLGLIDLSTVPLPLPLRARLQARRAQERPSEGLGEPRPSRTAPTPPEAATAIPRRPGGTRT